MVNQKRKGSNYEREAAKLLEKVLDGKWKRIPGSGALGAILSEPELQGDIVGKVHSFPKKFRFDSKVGYGGATQLTIKREWLEKIREEADATYSIPALICKFSGARGGIRNFLVLDFDAFAEIILNSERLQEELDKTWKEN
jgi:hypothetical protein